MTDDATIEEARKRGAEWMTHAGGDPDVARLLVLCDIATRRGEEIKKLKEPIKCIPTESGYMCSHCGTTLRADSPDYLPPARNPR
jgi:hypothetical protein